MAFGNTMHTYTLSYTPLCRLICFRAEVVLIGVKDMTERDFGYSDML